MFFFLTPTGDAWEVADPVVWCLENAQHPVLQRAREGLLERTASEGQRILRLVTRRCSLNLIEVRPQRVAVHYWGQQGLVDLRPFFKRHGRARRETQVCLIDRKREIISVRPGDDFLYGRPLPEQFPPDLLVYKSNKREIEQSDDRTGAPGP